MPKKGASKGETAVQVSAASFFASNQAIAGFDNPGKALFTSIRELVENSLDACEAIAQLPQISVAVEELSASEFSRIRGISGEQAAPPAASAESSSGSKSKKRGSSASTMQYFRITCRDNGCGMPHDQVPHMLGRVLSGSKYVVRQTRGKFGLGAKMALIWSKKSTGLPISVVTAHTATAKARARGPPSHVTRCVLDIDVHRNEPRVVSHKREKNHEAWVGSELSIVIGGAWTAYRRHVLRYMQQLAIITPYAELSFQFTAPSTDKSFSYRWARRALVMPPPAAEVRHHPLSVNNLVVRRLADLALGTADVVSARTATPSASSSSSSSRSTAKRDEDEDEDEDDDYAWAGDEDDDDEDESPPHRSSSSSSSKITVTTFLTKWFACVSKKAAGEIVAKLPKSLKVQGDTKLASFGAKHIHALTTALRAAKLPAPSGSCLSPVGEYNMRLGVLKELRPGMLATHAASPSAYDGHPFVVEAAVALGGAAPEGLTVHRFANRIPLLFEGGGDVATLTAQRLAWKSYGIDPKSDRVAVFVSIVSTKVPFKGTGKEYIGDDAEPIKKSVKSALQRCCQQLKVKLRRRQSAKDRASRAKSLTKYIPTVSKALISVLSAAVEREAAQGSSSSSSLSSSSSSSSSEVMTSIEGTPSRKRSRAVEGVKTGALTEAVLSSKLEAAVMRSDAIDAAAEAAEKRAATVAALSAGRAVTAGDAEARMLFAAPLGARVRSGLCPVMTADGSAMFGIVRGALTTMA